MMQQSEKLRFGIDIDGTISEAPDRFGRLITALLAAGNQVYIVTARDEYRRQETAALLGCFGIRYTELIMRPEDWPGSVPDYKARVVRAKGIQLMIDNDAENCWAINEQTNSLAAHMLPIPDRLEADEWQQRCEPNPE